MTFTKIICVIIPYIDIYVYAILKLNFKEPLCFLTKNLLTRTLWI